MQAILFKIPGQEWHWLGGMTLLERNLRLLSAAGVESALILHPPGDRLPALAVPRELELQVLGSAVEIATADPLTILPALRHELQKPFFLFEVNLLLDPRVLATLQTQSPPCFMVLGNGAYPPPWRVGWLTPDNLSLGNELLRKANRVSLRAVSPYNPELRGDVLPYCERMNSESDLVRGWRLLIDRVSKRPADLIEKYVDPPIENWLVHQLCDTAVTPNQVTLLSIAFALAGASLFYQGQLFLGVLFAWIAIVLDGVDGKLARVKLMTSPIGKLEHLADFFYENAWYLALAAHLSRTYAPSAWKVGLAIITCDICDNMIAALFSLYKGRTLDEMSSFDQRFRLIGGRRSIYLLILLAGFLLNAPLVAFQVVLGWAGLTVLIHLGRAVFHLLRAGQHDGGK